MFIPTTTSSSTSTRQPTRRSTLATLLTALVLVALAAVATVSTADTAQASDPYLSVSVSAGGDLDVEILQSKVELQVFQNGPDGYALWVFGPDAPAGDNDLLETHNVFGVTRNATFTVTTQNYLVIGREDQPVDFPGNLRIDDSPTTVHGSGSELFATSVAGDLRIATSQFHSTEWNGVTVGDDAILVGQDRLFLFAGNSDISDRLKWKAAGGLQGSLSYSTAGNTLIVGGTRNDGVTIRNSALGRTRIRLNEGHDFIVVEESSFEGRLTLRTNEGEDHLRLQGLSARELSALTDIGEDEVIVGPLHLERPERSTLAAGGDFDTLSLLVEGAVDAITTRQFESVINQFDN